MIGDLASEGHDGGGLEIRYFYCAHKMVHSGIPLILFYTIIWLR